MSGETPPDGVKPNRRQQAKARTAAKILTVAKALFDAGGYEPATIREIAKAAGMSTGAVFANYDSKADLYRAIYGHAPVTPNGGRRMLDVLNRVSKVLDQEIARRRTAGEDWLALEGLSDDLFMAVAQAGTPQ